MQEANGGVVGKVWWVYWSLLQSLETGRVNWGLGLKRGDELGCFRTTAAFLLVTRKPLMILELTG